MKRQIERRWRDEEYKMISKLLPKLRVKRFTLENYLAMVISTDILIEEAEVTKYDSLVFLDKSARVISHMIRERLKSHYVENIPQVHFADIGRGEIHRGGSPSIENLRDTFKSHNEDSYFDNKKVLIIDDYCRTGGTLGDAVNLFKKAFPKISEIKATSYAWGLEPFDHTPEWRSPTNVRDNERNWPKPASVEKYLEELYNLDLDIRFPRTCLISPLAKHILPIKETLGEELSQKCRKMGDLEFRLESCRKGISNKIKNVLDYFLGIHSSGDYSLPLQREIQTVDNNISYLKDKVEKIDSILEKGKEDSREYRNFIADFKTVSENYDLLKNIFKQ